MRQTMTPVLRSAETSEFAFDAIPAPVIAKSVTDVAGITMNLLGLPFDIARAQYARAVQVGLIERSMLGSRDFSRTMQALEQLTLGPWARHV